MTYEPGISFSFFPHTSVLSHNRITIHFFPLFSLPFPPISPFSNFASHAHPDLTMPKRKRLGDSERQAFADRPRPKSPISSISDAEDSDAVKAVV
jgi:hypothetical protein